MERLSMLRSGLPSPAGAICLQYIMYIAVYIPWPVRGVASAVRIDCPRQCRPAPEWPDRSLRCNKGMFRSQLRPLKCTMICIRKEPCLHMLTCRNRNQTSRRVTNSRCPLRLASKLWTPRGERVDSHRHSLAEQTNKASAHRNAFAVGPPEAPFPPSFSICAAFCRENETNHDLRV